MGRQGVLTVVGVCRRTGLSRKALRVYESMGSVEPAARSPAGYRLYDDEALRRIEFVRRAKLLGLSLAETKEFLHVAEGCCGENHPRLASLVEGKLAATEERIAGLQSLRESLQSVLDRLSTRNEGGHRCDEALCMCEEALPIEEGGDRSC